MSMIDDPKTSVVDGTDWDALRKMTDVEREAAAVGDPDAPPLPQGRRMYRLAASKRLRFQLKLSDEDFAKRYRIPLSAIQDWERYKAQPDAIAKAYLAAIEADPEGVARAVETIATEAAE